MLSNSEIKSAIAEIATSAASMRDKIHAVNVSIIGHAFMHGDVTLADSLLKSCGRGVDRQAIVTYLEDHGPFKWSKADGVFGLNKKFRAEHQYDETKLMTGAKWYEYGRSTRQITSKFDLRSKTLTLIKSLHNAEAEGKDVENAGLAAYLEQAVKAYNERQALVARKIAEELDKAPEGQDPATITDATAEGLRVAA